MMKAAAISLVLQWDPGNNAGSRPARSALMHGIHLGRDHAKAVAAGVKTQAISAIAWAGDHLSAFRRARE